MEEKKETCPKGQIHIDELVHITAIHEAGHYVLAILLNKVDRRYNLPHGFSFDVRIGEPFLANIKIAHYHLDVPLKSISARENYNRLRTFHGAAPIHTILDGYNLLAGIVTVKIHYIDIVNENDRLLHDITNFVAKNIPQQCSSFQFRSISQYYQNYINLPDGHDLKKIGTRLSSHRLPINQKINLLHQIVGSLTEIYSDDLVLESIHQVADILKSKNGLAPLKDDELDKITKEIQVRLKDFDMQKYIDETQSVWNSFLEK